MRYVADVASSLPSKAYLPNAGPFAHQVNSQGGGPKDLAYINSQGLGPKYPVFSVFGVSGCCWVFSGKQPGSGPKHPKRQWPPSPFYLALRAIFSALLVPWSAGDLPSYEANAAAACDA